METITYPLVCYPIQKDAYLGILIGTNFQAVDKDVRSIKATLSEYLQKQYKKYDEYPYIGILEPRLKIVEITVRPSYREKNGNFPFSHTLKVPLVCVFGSNDKGFYECHLPWFGESFYYYKTREFNPLIQHFGTNLLNNLSPEEINRILLHKKPELDTIKLKVNMDRDYNSFMRIDDHFPTLSNLAESYPPTKAVRKNLGAFPDAAWELESHVEKVIDQLINLRANLLLVGNHGVGKSSVLRQAIRKIHNQNKKQGLTNTFWQIVPQRITASSKYLGEWQETVEELIEDLISAQGILWVTDFIRLLQIGGEGPEDSVAAFLISFIQQGHVQLVGEVTPQELDSIKRLLPGFIENFQTLQIDELPEEKIHLIMEKIADYSRQNLKINIAPKALSMTYRLLLRYYPYESFPGKAAKFLGQCVNEAQINQEAGIETTDVIRNFIKQTGMPELFLRDDILLDTKGLNDFFKKRIIGQDEAVQQMANIVKVFKAGLNNPAKPISTMIFAGPTGVGKTASAQALASYFFGIGQKRSPMIRIDMSEFQHPGQITRFIGAGREVGKLVQDIRERPFSVLLLDEIEKADPVIFDVLLTVLDEGVLVDAYGRQTNFKNTIIIMTTNLGAANRNSIGFGGPDSRAYDSAIAKHFRPEFMNRIDSVVVFDPLKKEDILQITKKELAELNDREGFEKRGLSLKFSDELIQRMAEIGFDERYGARPLQRIIERDIVAPLAKWLLSRPKLQNKELKVDYQDGLKIETL